MQQVVVVFFTCIINNADSDGSIFEWQVYWADKLTHNFYTQKNKHKHTAKQRQQGKAKHE